jgi:hypothetical protein
LETFLGNFSLAPLPKEKNWTLHECMLDLAIGCMKFLFSKLFIAIFLLRNWGT